MTASLAGPEPDHPRARAVPDEVSWRRMLALGATGHREAPSFRSPVRSVWPADGRPIRAASSLVLHTVSWVGFGLEGVTVSNGRGCGKRIEQPTAARRTPGARPCKRCYPC